MGDNQDILMKMDDDDEAEKKDAMMNFLDIPLGGKREAGMAMPMGALETSMMSIPEECD